MPHPPIMFDTIELNPYPIRPFTHRLTITSGLWTHESILELPYCDIRIFPSKTPHHYVLACESFGCQSAEPFDRHLGHFAGCVSTLLHHFEKINPTMTKHLMQGVANALIYFGRQYGYITMDIEEGEVKATSKRDA